MKRILLFGIGLLLVVSCTNSSEEKPQETSFNTETPHDFMFMQRAYPSGEIKTDAYSKAIQWKKEQNQRSSSAVAWEFVGPVNVGGRVTDIEIPVDESQTYYVGTASGGIFKTIDAGANWMPIFDEQNALSIGDIEISNNDTDILWVGTGEVNAGGGSLAYDGNGMFKSEDAGLTWEAKGLTDVGSIGKVLIDPNNENIIFVGAMGPLFRNDNNRGVYRSIDGGTTWEQKLFVSDITGVIDMVNHPTNSNIIYAATWERIRRPEYRIYGGETSRLYRSLDGGDNWTEMTNGLPTGTNDKGRISIDISLSNPNVLYASYAALEGSLQAIYKTIDGGNTWTEENSSDINSSPYEWWFGGIFVDPTDEDTAFYLGFETYKTTNGASSWTNSFNNVHVDQHALAFNTMVGGEVLLGNDGGLFYSGDGGSTAVKDEALPITQFYRINVDAQDELKIYGGAQDNNTIRTTTGNVNDWNAIFGGDGFQPLADPNDTNVIYALSQNGYLGKSINNGANFSGATTGISGGDRNNWDTPITFDPSNSQVLYYGTNRLYKTTNAAGNWTAISPDLTNGSGGGNLTFGTIITIDVSPLDSSIIYVGTDDGNVWVTEDGGAIWNNISATLPDRWVTKVLASRDDINSVYVTFSGYRFGEDNGHVYKSSDKGANWIDISTALPDIPINDIVKDSYGNLFLGTDIGVLASSDDGITWGNLGENLPSVVVTDMYIHEATEYLYIGTYGRSMYKLDIADDVLANDNVSYDEGIFMYPNPASEFVNISMPSSSQKVSVIVFDQLGRQTLHQDFHEGGMKIQLLLSSIPQGVYFVKISSGKSQTTKKLLVK